MTSTRESFAAIDQLIDRIGQLHASPTVAQKLLQLTKNPDFEIPKVASCLEQDPALAARILRVVNSSRYGLTRRVSSIRHAAAYLGQRSLRMFAITFALVETLTSRSKSPLSKNYWPRAMTLATSASILSERFAPSCQDDAYTSGLLADVGILILAQLEADQYEPLFASCDHGPELLAAEQNLFHFTHPRLGARLLQRWEVPHGVVNAVANHHLVEQIDDELTKVVQTAECFSAAVLGPSEERVQLLFSRMESELGASQDDVVKIVEQLKERVSSGEELVDGAEIVQRSCQNFLLALPTLLPSPEEIA